MQLTPLGAAGGEVTGSAYLVENGACRVLVDCGLFQGGKESDRNNRASLSLVARQLDAVVLTHAHLDHTGRLPLLVRAGYTGPVFATPATIDLAGLILRDSAKIQAQDAERENRKRERAGRAPMEPLYSMTDVEATLTRFQPVPYHRPVPVAPGVEAVFVEAGHMLGSASIQLRVQNGERPCHVVFSGDLGPKGAPILRDSEPFSEANLVVLESTYGDRDHRPFRKTVDEFFEIVGKAVAEKGKILVPTFAVGRAQLLLMLMAYGIRNGLLPAIPMFLDSPMAIEASRIYRDHSELFDEEMVQFLKSGSLEQDLATLGLSSTAENSRAINDVPGPCLVLAGAGMCTAGRILHHLKQNLYKPETHVIIVGYQAAGSVGRMLVEGVKKLKLFGEQIAVRAKVHTLGGFSAHAGQTDLLHWFAPLVARKPRVVLTHGENKPRQALAAAIASQHQIQCELPELGQTISWTCPTSA